MFIALKSRLPIIYTFLIGLFFIFQLHFKAIYSVIPILIALIGMSLFFTQRKKENFIFSAVDKYFFFAIIAYFLLFVFSLFIHHGKLNELDLPARSLLVIGVIIFCYSAQIKTHFILSLILFSAFSLGVVAFIQVHFLQIEVPFPKIFRIEAGDISASIGLFAMAIAFHFYQQQRINLLIISLISAMSAFIASFLCLSRGAWIGLPVVFIMLIWCYRKVLSKKLIATILSVFVLCSALFAGNTISSRYQEFTNDIAAYQAGDHISSNGERLDMWKSALLGIQEKPLLGWGLQGVLEMRKQHAEQGQISEVAAGFSHAHNQYLHDASARGLPGLIALFAIFLIPLTAFIRQIKRHELGSQAHLWAVLGAVHTLSVMIYCLTQAFLSHNIGTMFYFFTVALCWGLQKTDKNQPLASK